MASTRSEPAALDKANQSAPEATSHPWLVVVVAQQRSGTTAFARTLHLGKKIHSYGEVFHNVRMTSPSNYFNFREQILKSQPRMAFASKEHQRTLWLKYLGFLKENASKPFVMIDAKYNSWHHFNGIWYLTGDAPAMVHLARAGGARIVHIVRRNLFEQACSAIIAERRQQFHFAETPEDQPTDLVLDPRGLFARMQRSHQQTELFRRFFNGYEHYSELRYEEMFDGGHLTTATLDCVRALIGEDCDGGSEVPLSKATPRLSDIVANSDDILQFFDDTRFGGMVAEALAR